MVTRVPRASDLVDPASQGRTHPLLNAVGCEPAAAVERAGYEHVMPGIGEQRTNCLNEELRKSRVRRAAATPCLPLRQPKRSMRENSRREGQGTRGVTTPCLPFLKILSCLPLCPGHDVRHMHALRVYTFRKRRGSRNRKAAATSCPSPIKVKGRYGSGHAVRKCCGGLWGKMSPPCLRTWDCPFSFSHGAPDCRSPFAPVTPVASPARLNKRNDLSRALASLFHI